MSELDPLISRSRSHSGAGDLSGNSTNRRDKWSATPGLRKDWSKARSASLKNLNSNRSSFTEPLAASLLPVEHRFLPHWIASGIDHTPGLLIALILNLFLSISFGNAFFPSTWIFPSDIPRSIGVSMFLFSTFISQIVFTFTSDFNVAVGMMMVENIPFMHIIANNAIDAQGMGKDTFATVFVAFALCSLLVGILFFLLGYFKLGSAVYFIPRHCIIGCIGGIGIFIFMTGLEVSTNLPLTLTTLTQAYFTSYTFFLWMTPLMLDGLLRLIVYLFTLPLLPPFFFVSIPPLFYLTLVVTRIPLATAHTLGWFFEKSPPAAFYQMWTLFDYSVVNWYAIWDSLPTMVALCIFSLMHAPINIPSLTISTGIEVSMDKELVNHGYTNILSGMLGGLQNYLCYSNSLLYFKCKGKGKISGLLLSICTFVFFIFGPSIVEYVPRCMAGCLLLHVGIDLTKEALYDTYGIFDKFEYTTILVITFIMTTFGMTAGLAFCVICAALTFTVQEGNFVNPIRGIMPATTLRSTTWRTSAATEVLKDKLQHVTVFQLQGTIFFGNASTLSKQVQEYLAAAQTPVWVIVLDFTLVVSIDSSAADTIAKIVSTCKAQNVRLCYCRGSKEGFPTMFPLTKTIEGTDDDTVDVFDGLVSVCDTLDEAISWCEDAIIYNSVSGSDQSYDISHLKRIKGHLWQLFCLCPTEDIHKLMEYFKRQTAHQGTVLWRQGALSNHAILLVTGELQSLLEEEAGTVEAVLAGHLVGEYGLLFGQNRYTTMLAVQDSEVLVLSKDALAAMEEKDPHLALLLYKICMGYLGRRVHHVSNRIWESHCIPI